MRNHSVPLLEEAYIKEVYLGGSFLSVTQANHLGIFRNDRLCRILTKSHLDTIAVVNIELRPTVIRSHLIQLV